MTKWYLSQAGKPLKLWTPSYGENTEIGDQKSELILLVPDAEKAFERIGWNYMFKVLKAIGMQAHMLSWIKAI